MNTQGHVFDRGCTGLSNRDAPELRKFWVFPANPEEINKLLQLKYHAIAQIIGCMVVHREAITVKFVWTPGLAGKNPHLLSSG